MLLEILRKQVKAEQVIVSLNGKTLRMPRFVTPDLEFISHADEFTAYDLPGDPNESERLVLIKHLVREGILKRLVIGRDEAWNTHKERTLPAYD